MGRWRLGAPAVVALVGLALVGCGEGEDRPGAMSGTGSDSGSGTATHHGGEAKAAFPESEADTQVSAIMRDFSISVPESVKGEKVLFRVENQGPSDHEFVVVDEDGKELGEIGPYGKGRTETLAVALRPGSYRATCLIQLGDRTHADMGMDIRFTVE